MLLCCDENNQTFLDDMYWENNNKLFSITLDRISKPQDEVSLLENVHLKHQRDQWITLT